VGNLRIYFVFMVEKYVVSFLRALFPSLSIFVHFPDLSLSFHIFKRKKNRKDPFDDSFVSDTSMMFINPLSQKPAARCCWRRNNGHAPL
jgi:hypothetical protein